MIHHVGSRSSFQIKQGLHALVESIVERKITFQKPYSIIRCIGVTGGVGGGGKKVLASVKTLEPDLGKKLL